MDIQFLPSCFGDPQLQMATTYVVNGRRAIDAGCLGLADMDLQKQVTDVVLTHVHLDHVATYRSYLAAGKGTPENNLAYGNIEGGLSTIAEKALGSVAKGGTTTLAWVNDYAELITEKGFGFMNTTAFDPASCTGQTAGGAQVGVFSTGAGS